MAYNRVYPLKRLLDSISSADYKGYNNVELAISIDKSECREVYEIAHNFKWPYGSKNIIEHKEHIGYKKHIKKCLKLSEKYGSVITLEDDTLVSPLFFRYACEVLSFFGDDNNIAGFPLYSCEYNVTKQSLFIPIDDGYDVYFTQWPAATALWTKKQVKNIENWIEKKENLIQTDSIVPKNIQDWPDHSFSKDFIKYIVANKKYVVAPRVSLATYFCEKGVNFNKKQSIFQVPIVHRKNNFRFCKLENSMAVYDIFAEIEGECLKKYSPHLKAYDIEIDLYGIKPLDNIKSKYILTSKDVNKKISSYAFDMIPPEANIIYNLKGDFFNLAETKDCQNQSIEKKLCLKQRIGRYEEKMLTGKECLQILKNKIKDKLKNNLF